MSGQKRLTAQEYEIPKTLSQKQLAILQVLRQTAAILRVEMTPLEIETWGRYLEEYSTDEVTKAFEEWVKVGNGRYPKPSKITEIITRYRNESLKENKFIACGLDGCDSGFIPVRLIDFYEDIASNSSKPAEDRNWAENKRSFLLRTYGEKGAQLITGVKVCSCRKRFFEKLKGVA